MHGHYWWPLLEDVFTADPVQKMRQDLLEEALQADELTSVSIDATLRCCLSIIGQASYRAPAAVRAQAAFDDVNSKRRVLTLRGRTNAVVGMVPIAEETAEIVAGAISNLLSYRARVTVRHVACDNPSSKLFDALTTIFPNLQTMALDAVHLPIVYEYATWRQRTAGSGTCVASWLNSPRSTRRQAQRRGATATMDVQRHRWTVQKKACEPKSLTAT